MLLNFRKTAAAMALTICAGQFAVAAMTDLGTLGGNDSYALGISANGSIIVGEADISGSSYHHAFKYTGTTITDLGTLGGNSSTATGASADGTIIVGDSTTSGNSNHRAFKYTGTTMTALGTLGGDNSYAAAISADGSVIVGNSALLNNIDCHAFKYTTAGGMVDIGTLGGSSSYAYGASADGSVIVGEADLVGTPRHAFKYTTTGGMVDLGDFGGNSIAYAVSSDGSTIVGSSYLTGNVNQHAFKYTATDGMVDLNTLGGTNSTANAVSADGSVIVGYSSLTGDTADHAIKYTGTTMTDLGTLGGTNSYAAAVSADGSVIVGVSHLSGDTVQHAFIYRSVMVDAPNTVTAIANNAGQMNSVLNLKSSLLVNALDSDCARYGDNGVCLSLSGWHYSGQESALAAQTATTLKASYRFSSNFRAGMLADLSFSAANPDNFHVSRTPLFGAFAVFGNNETGNGAQLKLSAAYNKADANITRTVLTNTEAGNGDSTFKSFGAKAELGYGKEVASWKALPYVGLQWTNVSRGGYAETSGATFPVVYNDIAQKQFTALAGVRAESNLTAELGVGGGIGLEQDLHSSMGAYNGTMDTLGAFDLVAPNVTNTRPFANIAATYDLGKNQRIGVGLNVRRQSLGTTYGTLVSGQYTVAF